MHNLTKRLMVVVITLSLMLIPTKAKAKSYKWTKQEETLIQKIMYLEANTHGVKGMALVGRTIMNRVKSKKFPNTVTKVIYARNQFSTVKYLKRGKITKNTKEALKQLKKGKHGSMDALFFCAKSSYRGWWKNLKVVYRYKNHVYCK